LKKVEDWGKQSGNCWTITTHSEASLEELTSHFSEAAGAWWSEVCRYFCGGKYAQIQLSSN